MFQMLRVQSLAFPLSAFAPGPNSIPNHVLKSPPLTHPINDIFNFVFKLWHFPSPWKCTKVLPIIKHGNCKTDLIPLPFILLLNSLSKILEQHILDNTLSFIDNHDLLNLEQFDLNKFHSTVQQLNKIINFILINLDQNTATVIM